MSNISHHVQKSTTSISIFDAAARFNRKGRLSTISEVVDIHANQPAKNRSKGHPTLSPTKNIRLSSQENPQGKSRTRKKSKPPSSSAADKARNKTRIGIIPPDQFGRSRGDFPKINAPSPHKIASDMTSLHQQVNNMSNALKVNAPRTKTKRSVGSIIQSFCVALLNWFRKSSSNENNKNIEAYIKRLDALESQQQAIRNLQQAIDDPEKKIKTSTEGRNFKKIVHQEKGKLRFSAIEAKKFRTMAKSLKVPDSRAIALLKKRKDDLMAQMKRDCIDLYNNINDPDKLSDSSLTKLLNSHPMDKQQKTASVNNFAYEMEQLIIDIDDPNLENNFDALRKQFR